MVSVRPRAEKLTESPSILMKKGISPRKKKSHQWETSSRSPKRGSHGKDSRLTSPRAWSSDMGKKATCRSCEGLNLPPEEGKDERASKMDQLRDY